MIFTLTKVETLIPKSIFYMGEYYEPSMYVTAWGKWAICYKPVIRHRPPEYKDSGYIFSQVVEKNLKEFKPVIIGDATSPYFCLRIIDVPNLDKAFDILYKRIKLAEEKGVIKVGD